MEQDTLGIAISSSIEEDIQKAHLEKDPVAKLVLTAIQNLERSLPTIDELEKRLIDHMVDRSFIAEWKNKLLAQVLEPPLLTELGNELLARTLGSSFADRKNQLRHVLPELHDPDTGRLDANRLAKYMGVTTSDIAKALQKNPRSVLKNPSAESVQEGLQPIARVLSIMSRQCEGIVQLKAWLNTPHPDLDKETPLSIILKGEADIVEGMLDATLRGQTT